MDKKAYKKPDITFVDFSLSSSIAGSCGLVPNSAQFTCDTAKNENGWLVFSAKNPGCEDMPLDHDICYHVPIADTNVFSS